MTFDFEQLVRRRRMRRAFTTEPVPSDTVDRLLDLARRGPSAGNTSALEFLVLEDDDVARYWDVTLPDSRRADFPWPELLAAPVIVIPWVEPEAYRRRYAEADKRHTGLGDGTEQWSVPYWFVDGGAAAMTLLLAAESVGLGALLFGLFEHEPAVRSEFGVPSDRRAIGAVALGHPSADRRSASARRPRPPLDAVVHRGGW